MKNFEVHDLTEGWVGQAPSLLEALAIRDGIQENFPDHEVLIKAEVDESDLEESNG